MDEFIYRLTEERIKNVVDVLTYRFDNTEFNSVADIYFGLVE